MLNLRMCSRDDVGLARAALLAEKANEYAFFESLGGLSDAAMRRASRDMLKRDATKLGFPKSEIEPAIDAALNAATTKEPATT